MASAPAIRINTCWSSSLASRTSREDDLAAGGFLVELADADDLVDLGNEVVHGEAEHVDGGLAGVEVGAGVGDELDELGDGWDVDLLHLLLHHLGGEGGEAGDGADPGGQVHAGVADGGDLDLLVAVFADRVEA